MKQLTDELIDKMCPKGWPHGPGRLFARMLIDKFCRINNITGETQPAEYITGIDGPPLQSAADDKAARDWSLLEATQESLREHMALVKELQGKLAEANVGGEAVADYWRAGDSACPQEIKAANGELTELRCKNCGRPPSKHFGTEKLCGRIELVDIDEGTRPQPQAIPAGYALVSVDAMKRWRDAFAEELSAWDIDPPLHHVLTSHDEIVAMLKAAPKVK